jgi:hypothetical protein
VAVTNRLSLEEPDSDRILGYDRVPSSESTFDSLVVGIGGSSSVLLGVEDEDEAVPEPSWVGATHLARDRAPGPAQPMGVWPVVASTT